MKWKYINWDGWPAEDGWYICALQIPGSKRTMTLKHWRDGGFLDTVAAWVYAYLKDAPPLEPEIRGRHIAVQTDTITINKTGIHTVYTGRGREFPAVHLEKGDKIEVARHDE